MARYRGTGSGDRNIEATALSGRRDFRLCFPRPRREMGGEPAKTDTRRTSRGSIVTPSRTDAHPARGASRITLLAGVWLFISPWIYADHGYPDAWNIRIAGVLIFLFALMRLNRPSAVGLSWANTILGIWIFVSPWVYGYTGRTGEVIISLVTGLIVFCAGVIGANSQRMSHQPNAGL